MSSTPVTTWANHFYQEMKIFYQETTILRYGQPVYYRGTDGPTKKKNFNFFKFFFKFLSFSGPADRPTDRPTD